MTCIMDPVYQPRPHQPMWGPPAAPVPTLDMEYYIPHHPPFTSPPATPMTPVTPHPHIFNPPHYEQAMPAPPPPNPFPPSPQQSYPSLDVRLYALCQQLLTYSQMPTSHHKAFWDQFMIEYFTDTATLTIAGDFGEGHRKYSLTRQWIQWYFKTMLENGVIGLWLRLPHFSISFTPGGGHQLECNEAVMETDINMATRDIVKVCTTGSLAVEFSLEEKPRIISWFFAIGDHQEFVPRSSLCGIMEDKSLTVNITNHGLLPAVHSLLSRAGLVDTSLQDALPACSGTPTTVPMAPLQSNAPPPPLHVLPPCSVTLAPQEKTGKPPQQPSPLSSSSKKMRPPLLQHSPAARGQFIMVAAEATTLLQAADDLVPGLDERMIIRVDNTRPTSSHSPAHCNGSSDASAETTPIAPPTCAQDPGFLSATLSQVPSLAPSLSWTSPDLSLPPSSLPGTSALASAK